MSDLPLVTIVTPSYNQGSYIEETIQSVLNQDYPNIEYFIIDGGSTDNSTEIIKKYENKISYWISEKDQGQADAIGKGFRRAKGKYLTWLCSDDTLEPSMIRYSVHFLEKFPKAVLSYGNRTRIDSKGNIISFSKSFISPELFKFGLGLPQETVLFRREIYEDVGGIDPDLNMVMDYDLWCKMYNRGWFCYIPTYLGRFRSHESNKSSQFSVEMAQNNFEGNLTNEFSKIYKLHFRKKFSPHMRKIALTFNTIFRFLFFTSRKYRLLKMEITELRKSE
jgi:glycosyltransferase involved in cell wall biosynthesis